VVSTVNGWRSGLDAASAGVDGGVRWCRGCLAGRGGVYGHAARPGRRAEMSFESGRRGLPCTSEDGRRILLADGVRGPIAVAAYQRPLPLPASVFGASRQPVRVGPCADGRVSSCSGGRERRSDRRARQMGGCFFMCGPGMQRRSVWTSSGRRYMGRLLHLHAREKAPVPRGEAAADLLWPLPLLYCCFCLPIHAARCLASPSDRPRTRQLAIPGTGPCHGRACRSPHIASPPHRIISPRPRPPARRQSHGRRDGDADEDGRRPAARGRHPEPHRPHPHRVLSLPHGRPHALHYLHPVVI
jgi:hypothetical protein